MAQSGPGISQVVRLPASQILRLRSPRTLRSAELFRLSIAVLTGALASLAFAQAPAPARPAAPAARAAAPASRAPIVPLDRVIAVVNDEAVTQWDVAEQR